MKKVLVSSVLALASLFVSQAQATVLHVENAQMKVMEATREFASARNVEMTFQGWFDPSHGEKKAQLTVSFDGDKGSREELQVEVQDIQTDTCGSVTYSGNYFSQEEGLNFGKRLHIALTDHRTMICEIGVDHLWEVEVSQGVGSCGTMDSTMSLRGSPEQK